MTDVSPRPDAIPKLEANLKPSADGSAFEIYRANSAPTTAISLPAGASAADFWFRTTSYQLPDAVIFRVGAAAQTMHRGAEEIALGANQFMIAVHLAGWARGCCGDRDIRVEPGDIAIYDNAHGCDTETSDFDILGVLVARERLPPLFQVPGVHGAVIHRLARFTRLETCPLIVGTP